MSPTVLSVLLRNSCLPLLFFVAELALLDARVKGFARSLYSFEKIVCPRSALFLVPSLRLRYFSSSPLLLPGYLFGWSTLTYVIE